MALLASRNAQYFSFGFISILIYNTKMTALLIFKVLPSMQYCSSRNLGDGHGLATSYYQERVDVHAISSRPK